MRDRPPMTVADRDTFLALRRVLPAATKTCLRETFGLSETTWVKLRDSRPVKASTLERVLTRYRRLCLHGESRASDRGAPPDAKPALIRINRPPALQAHPTQTQRVADDADA